MTSVTWGTTAVWGCALAIALWAGVLDWRSRKIPNWLTVPAFLCGLGLNTVFNGWDGLKTGAEGTAMALGLLFLPVLMRGMGAGDWKMMGALGAFLGPWNIVTLLFISILIAGFMAAVEMVRRRRIKQTFVNLATLFQGIMAFGLRPSDASLTIDNPRSIRLPFGVAAAIAMVVLVCMRRHVILAGL